MNTRKTSKPKAKPSKAPTAPTSKQTTASTTEPSVPTPAMVHDLVGAAFLILPRELRTLIGDQALQANAQDLQEREVLVIVREPGVVAYAHLPIIAMEMEGTASDLAGGGTTLRPITGAWTQRLKEKLKGQMKGQKKRALETHDMVTVVEPSDKGGHHA